jgi:hypothetical protein
MTNSPLELLVFLYLVLTVLDVATTTYAIERGASEANPIVAKAMALLGDKWVILKVLAVVLAFVFKDEIGEHGLWIMNSVMLAVVGWNLRQILLLKKGR